MASHAHIFGTLVDEPAPTALGAYERTVDTAWADFAEFYAHQNDLDYAALDGVVKTGRVKALEGCRPDQRLCRFRNPQML